MLAARVAKNAASVHSPIGDKLIRTVLFVLQRLSLMDEAVGQMPVRYCENVAVNAALSYYAALAEGRRIRCDLRLDIPEKLPVTDLITDGLLCQEKTLRLSLNIK